VQVKSTIAVGFIGRSGQGKSTLSAAMHHAGALLISDDCILLKPDKEQVSIFGGLLGVRLLPDSRNAVFHETGGFTRYSPYSEKQQLLIEKESGSTQATKYKLSAMYFLDTPETSAPEQAISIVPLSLDEALGKMMDCTFSLDPSDQLTRASNIYALGKATTDHLQLFSLGYPRKLDQLPEVVEAITQHAMSIQS
jgi:hypothetical protein